MFRPQIMKNFGPRIGGALGGIMSFCLPFTSNSSLIMVLSGFSYQSVYYVAISLTFLNIISIIFFKDVPLYEKSNQNHEVINPSVISSLDEQNILRTK